MFSLGHTVPQRVVDPHGAYSVLLSFRPAVPLGVADPILFLFLLVGAASIGRSAAQNRVIIRRITGKRCPSPEEASDAAKRAAELKQKAQLAKAGARG